MAYSTETDTGRRSFIGAGIASGVGLAVARMAGAQTRTDTDPRNLNGQPMPEPSNEQSAGPVRLFEASSRTGGACRP
jgi:hypothetical protein